MGVVPDGVFCPARRELPLEEPLFLQVIQDASGVLRMALAGVFDDGVDLGQVGDVVFFDQLPKSRDTPGVYHGGGKGIDSWR